MHVSFVLLVAFLFQGPLQALTARPVSQLAQERSQYLVTFANHKKRPTVCPTTVRYLSTQNQYGRTGNRWMQYGNLLWLSEILQYTVFISPKEKSLQHFNLSTLAASFCIATSLKQLPIKKLEKSMSIKPVTVHSYAHMNEKFRGVNDTQLLPNEADREVRTYHAEVMLTFYAALFGRMKESDIDMGTQFLQQSLESSGQYVAIHKRHFEQQCVRLMFQRFNFSDFSVEDFDKSAAVWQDLLVEEQRLQRTNFYSQNHVAANVDLLGLAVNFHPLCNMTPGVILGAQQAHRLSEISSYVLLTDHQEPVPAYLQSHPVNVTVRPKDNGKGSGGVMVDLFVALHSALLIRNPYSTLTMPVDILRVILNMPTSSFDRSSNLSLTLMGSWLTMSDIRDVLRRRNHVPLY